MPTKWPVAAGGFALVYSLAFAQITKTGFVFVLDRRTGESLFPIEYRKVPASPIDGEQLADTRPHEAGLITKRA